MPIARTLVETLGFEIESAFLTQDDAINLCRNNSLLGQWRVHNDSSINTQRYSISGIPFTLKDFSSSGNISARRQTFGAEIVSPPIDTQESSTWMDELKTILEYISSRKEIPQNETSIHIHVNCAGMPLFVVQNLIGLWTGLEATIYRLGVAEKGTHRGEERKDYLYCRPLSSPHVVISSEGLRHSYSVDQMLKTKNYAEFFTAYGNVPLNREPNKYHPARYSGLNFFSLQSINTIEFRVFNMTSDYRNVVAWADLVKSMVRMSMGKPIELEDQPLGFNGDFSIGRLQSILELSDSTAFQLESLWNKANWCKPVKNELFTHSNHSAIDWPKFRPKLVESAARYLDDTNYEIVTYESLTGRSRGRNRNTRETTIDNSSTEQINPFIINLSDIYTTNTSGRITRS